MFIVGIVSDLYSPFEGGVNGDRKVSLRPGALDDGEERDEVFYCVAVLFLLHDFLIECGKLLMWAGARPIKYIIT